MSSFPAAVKRVMVFIAFFYLCSCLVGSEIISPFQSRKFEPVCTIDRLVLGKLQKDRLNPANICSDEVFIRRVFLDVIGTLPDAKEVRDFLEDQHPNKRAVLINQLLKRDEYAIYWSLKWCDLLRVKAEFPINLWPNAVQAYHRWIQESIGKNVSYDKFVRAMLTSSGSNFRKPEVNFYRSIQGNEPEAIAKAAALNFMGVRLEKQPEKYQQGMITLFSAVAYKKTAEWKEEIVYSDPKVDQAVEVVMPDGKLVKVQAGQDRREAFADWLINGQNPFFCRNIVNRAWYWLVGRAIIEEPDDIWPGNTASNLELLTYLEKEFAKSGYNLEHLFKIILNSSTYQQSSIPASEGKEVEKFFGCYVARQLPAEVLIDAICKITGTKESYSSPIPEPFTFIPEDQRSIDLADGSITSQFLEMFGRPSRDTGLESERNSWPNDAQRLHLLNSSHIQNKINQSWRLRGAINQSRRNNDRLIDTIYITILSRYPTDEERDTFAQYMRNTKGGINTAVNDLAWALINSKEFLFRH